MSPYVRTVRTASGATAVQVVYSRAGGRRELTHVGSAHTDDELAVLRAQAEALIHQGQYTLDLGLDQPAVDVDGAAVATVVGKRAGLLLDAIDGAYRAIGLDQACGGDAVFENLVRARIIQPGSKFDSIETLQEVGVSSASYATIKRHLPTYATEEFQQALSAQLCSYRRIGAGMLILYDVTTLYFETDTPDELRKSGFSKERRVEPQITVGMLSDAAGFPLAIAAFEGNRGETTTMIPMIKQLQQAYALDTVTVVADAGMFSASNKQQIIDADLNYIIGVRFTDLPYAVKQWREDNRGQEYTDGQIWEFADRHGRGPDGVPHSVTYYQYSAKRAQRTIKGIDEQLSKAEQAIEKGYNLKRNRYITMRATNKEVNYILAAKNKTLAGIKGYETSRIDLTAQEVITAYRQLLKIEKSFRMSKSDLKARPIYHHKEESIRAHLSVVMAALAVSHTLEQQTGLSIRRLVRTLKKYETTTINIKGHQIQAQPALPPEVQQIIKNLNLDRAH